MKQPQDHLRSKKQPVRKTVWIAGDNELAEELEGLERELAQAKNARDSRSDRNLPPSDSLEAEINRLSDEVAVKKLAMKENSLKFVFRALNRNAYDQLLERHPPTEEQIKLAQAENGEKTDVPFNPDTFPMDLVLSAMEEPNCYGDAEVRAYWEQELSGDNWNSAEFFTLFLAANTVQQTRRVLDLGKG